MFLKILLKKSIYYQNNNNSQNNGGLGGTPPPQLPQITVNDRQFRDILTDAWTAVQFANRTTLKLFTRANMLVELKNKTERRK